MPLQSYENASAAVRALLEDGYRRARPGQDVVFINDTARTGQRLRATVGEGGQVSFKAFELPS